MKKAIWATYYHKLSTKENPKHGLFPTGEESWCKYNKAPTTGEVYNHKNYIPEDILQKITTVFNDFSNEALLKKCLHGKTQNVNESLNNVIRSLVPKKTFVSLDTLELGAFDAIACFNQGLITECQVLENKTWT